MRTLTFYQMEHSQPKKTGTSSFLCHPTEDDDNKSTLYLKRKSNTIQIVQLTYPPESSKGLFIPEQQLRGRQPRQG
jgi:hypothetical protein